MKNILVVDDSPTTLHIIKTELNGCGFEIVEARSGKEAIGTLVMQAPDLITLDLEMPGMDGYETLKSLRNTWELLHVEKPFPPVVLVTGRDTVEEREKGFSHGVANFIAKPFVSGQLREVVLKLLTPSKAYMDMRVLVVDDSKVVRRIVTDSLREAGIMHIDEADNGSAAFDILKESSHKINLVITDYLMPHMDGAELCQKAREELNLKTVPFVFMSQLPERSSVLKIFQAGATDYLMKPFVKEELIARIRTHFETSRLNQALEDRVHELQKLSNMKDNLISMTSHDIRSPLSGIIGLAEMTIMEEDIANEVRENLTMIKDAGQFILELANDILDLSALEAEDQALEVELVDMKEIAAYSLRTFVQQAHAKKINLEDDTGADEPIMIMGNRNALTRVINNLISNAVKFTREDGTVTVRIKKDEDRTLLSVLDTGIGVAEEDIPKLFDRFSKTSRPGTGNEKGTGLGLCISKNLVNKQNGNLIFESKVGEGTSITLDFPSC